MTDTTTDTPRIYVACLASYNAGILHGEWIDATDADVIREAIQEMLKGSPSPGAEEWAIHDYEGFGSTRLGEWEDIDRVAELGALIDEHGEAFAAYADHVGVDYATEESFQDAFAASGIANKPTPKTSSMNCTRTTYPNISRPTSTTKLSPATCSLTTTTA